MSLLEVSDTLLLLFVDCGRSSECLPVECDLGRQAGDLVAVLSEDIGEHSVCSLKKSLANCFTFLNPMPGEMCEVCIPEGSPWEYRHPSSTTSHPF
jgi:hypothetical protein